MTQRQDEHGTQNQSFTWGSSLLSATEYGNMPTGNQNESRFHYLHDHLGSPIRLQSSINNSSETMSYDEFGVPETTPITQSTQRFNNFNNPFGFTGYQMDDISGMYYAQARYYEPTINRFISEDPIKDRNNWYQYCNSNPLRLIDPSGLTDTLVPIRDFVEGLGGNVCWNDAMPGLAVAELNGRTLVSTRQGANLSHIDITNVNGSLTACALDLVYVFFPESRNQPITVLQYGNNVVIAAHLYFTEDIEARIDGSTIMHREVVIDGITSYWSGDIGPYNVNTYVRDVTGIDGTGQASLVIDIRDQGGRSHLEVRGNWSVTNTGFIASYNFFRGNVIRTEQDVRWTAAHEFGHALGIGDGIGYGFSGNTELGDFISIMTRRDVAPTRLDLELVLKAHRENTFQHWSNNLALIAAYGIGSFATVITQPEIGDRNIHY